MLSLPSKHVVKALLSLSEKNRGEFISVSELSEGADLPVFYLAKLMKQLSEAKIVVTRKGPNGGVAMPNRKISLLEICKALDDPIVSDSCLISRETCSDKAPCPLHSRWQKERQRIQGFLRELHI